jgi:hypothetical protein
MIGTLAAAQSCKRTNQYGDFGKHVTIRVPGRILPFSVSSVFILLDDPQGPLSTGEDAYTAAEGKLRAAAARGGIPVTIHRRQCGTTCQCHTAGYSGSYSGLSLDALF